MPSAKINYFKLEYTDEGIGRPVVLIHGYPFNRSLWSEQIITLSTAYRVIAPDLRGFGDSDAVPGTATMDEMAQDVVLLLNHLGIARATICGLSMGGYVALALYKQFPSRFVENVFNATASRRRVSLGWMISSMYPRCAAT